MTSTSVYILGILCSKASEERWSPDYLEMKLGLTVAKRSYF